MPDINQIEALIARVEAATGADRDIDIDLCMLTEDYSRRAYGHYCHQAPRGTNPTVREFLSDRLSSSYTSSIDAIVGLIERELPDHNVHVFSDCGSYFARVEFFDRDWKYFSGFDGAGVRREDWCLSAISAFLRALKSKEQP